MSRLALISTVALAKRISLLAGFVLLIVALATWFLRRQALRAGRIRLARGLALSSFLAVSPIVLGAGLYTDTVFIEPNWLQIERVRVKNPALAPALAGLRIVQVSDLHLKEAPQSGTSLDKNFKEAVPFRVRRMVRLVNALRPDAIVVTGDFVSGRGGMERALNALDGWRRPPFGIWAVPGNTDEIFYSKEEMKKLCKEHGIELLANERRRLTWGDRAPFCLAGVDDPTYRKDNLSLTLEGIPVELPILLLGHSPSDRLIQQAADRRVPLLLVGHTHGGQIGIPWLRRLSDYANRTPYMAGLFHIQGMSLYVNRGIGMKTRDIRLLCRPEITALEVIP